MADGIPGPGAAALTRSPDILGTIGSVTGAALDAQARKPTHDDPVRSERVPVRAALRGDLDDGHAVDRRWAEERGVFELRTRHREFELVVMPGQDDRTRDVARRPGVPESVRLIVLRVRDHPRGPHEIWTWTWDEVKHLPVDGYPGDDK